MSDHDEYIKLIKAVARERGVNQRIIANAANVSPQITTGNVSVECLTNSFAVVPCGSEPPANVRVSITGFNVTLGEWFPFYSTGSGGGNFGTVPLVPHTTMRYMN